MLLARVSALPERWLEGTWRPGQGSGYLGRCSCAARE